MLCKALAKLFKFCFIECLSFFQAVYDFLFQSPYIVLEMC